jgi:hypothetical protein
MDYKQKLLSFAAVTAALAAYSLPGLANVQTWTMNSNQAFSSNTTGNNLTMTSSDGIHLKITGYSDTNDILNAPDTVETGKLIWATTNGLGLQNNDEDLTPPNHSIDSQVSGTVDPDGDYDMVLLEFDTAVNLTGLQLNWAVGGNAANTADISILAYTGNGSSTLVGNTWAQVLGSGTGNAYDSVGNYSNVGLSYYAVNPTNVTSTKWLIGAYNPVFGSGGTAGNDGLKLTSLTTSTPTPDTRDVPVPGTVVLLMSGLVALRSRIGKRVAR